MPKPLNPSSRHRSLGVALTLVSGVILACGGGVSTKEDFEEKSVKAQCEWAVECTDAYSGVNECVEQSGGSTSHPDCVYDEELGRECISGIESLACDSDVNDTINATQVCGDVCPDPPEPPANSTTSGQNSGTPGGNTNNGGGTNNSGVNGTTGNSGAGAGTCQDGVTARAPDCGNECRTNSDCPSPNTTCVSANDGFKFCLSSGCAPCYTGQPTSGCNYNTCSCVKIACQ